MDELLKAFKDFITRDFAYVICGSCVIASALWAVDALHLQELSTGLLLFAVGVSYIVGYLIQEGFSFLGLITTARIRAFPKPGNQLLASLYKRFTHEDWIDIRDVEELQKNYYRLLETKNDRLWADYQRIVSFKHVGTAVASNGIICGIILVIVYPLRAVVVNSVTFNWKLLIVGVICLIFATIAWALGWLKAAQQSRFLEKSAQHLNDGKTLSQQTDNDPRPQHETGSPRHS